MSSRNVHEHYSSIIRISKKLLLEWREQDLLQAGIVTCSVDKWLLSYGEYKRNIGANIGTEPSCELVDSSSQKQLQGGSYIAASYSILWIFNWYIHDHRYNLSKKWFFS